MTASPRRQVRHSGAGILPVAVDPYSGEVYLLFGQEHDGENEWSDFGGASEGGESPAKTAAREGAEELMGFLGSTAEMLRELRRVNVWASLDGYTSFVIVVPYDELLPMYFRQHFLFTRTRTPRAIGSGNGLYEKSAVRWVRLQDVKRGGDRALRFRPFYRRLLDTGMLPILYQKLLPPPRSHL